MIKELWKLVRLLFGSRPSDYVWCELSVEEWKHFPFDKKKCMTWCGVIIKREGSLPLTDVRMNHEKIHILQAMMCDDNWVRYYLNYLWNWLKHCPWVAPSKACYYINKYEAEAFANEEDFGYCEDYNGGNLKKYDIKNAKKKWKELGGTKAAWIKYIKNV